MATDNSTVTIDQKLHQNQLSDLRAIRGIDKLTCRRGLALPDRDLSAPLYCGKRPLGPNIVRESQSTFPLCGCRTR